MVTDDINTSLGVKNENFGSRCNLQNKNNHSSGPLHISNPYGGIPQNLITNSVGLVILLIVFLILRKSALKVLNKIVKKDDVEKWTHLFFSFTASMVDSGLRTIRRDGR